MLDWNTWNSLQKVSFLPEQKLISIRSGYTIIDVQIDLYSSWKEWIQYDDNAKWSAAFRTFGGDETAPNQYAPRYFFLMNSWKIYAENISVIFQTNLYSDDGLSPFIINNAAITNKTSDSPIVKTDMEKRLDYGDKVYLDETSIYSGFEYPNGTIIQPVNNLIDAISISNLYNINKIYCLSDLNIDYSGLTIEKYSFIADKEKIYFNLFSGSTLRDIIIDGFIINGNFNGENIKINNSIINDVIDISGQIKNSQIQKLKPNDNLVVFMCYSNDEYSLVDLKLSNNLSIRSFSGNINLTNCDNIVSTLSIELIAGHVIIDNTCVNGVIDLRGVGYLVDNSSGATVITTGFVSQTLTSEDVAKLTGITSAIDEMTIAVDSLDEKVSYISGATYEMNENVTIMTSGFTNIEIAISGMTESINNMETQISTLDEQIKRILGLSQENFRIMNHTYSSTNNLDSATVKIFNNSSDCDNNINPLATYSMIALYDSSGRLVDYKVTKN